MLTYALGLGLLLLAVLHVYITQPSFAAGLAVAQRWLASHFREEEGVDLHRRQREEDELFRIRVELMYKVARLTVHLMWVQVLASAWILSQQPSLSSSVQLLSTLSTHCVDLALVSGIAKLESPGRWRCVELLLLCSLICFQAAHATEPDDPNAMLSRTLSSRFWDMSYLVSCTAFIDWTAPSVCYLCLAAVQLYMDESNSQTLVCSLTSYFMMMCLAFCLVHVIQSSINASLDLGDVSSLMQGFREVLRGVCDGALVLNRQQCTILDDASSLERLLKSQRKLANTSFLELFLDAESRQRFTAFVERGFSADGAGTVLTDGAGPARAQRVPRGFRVALQGAEGIVSLDLFQTTLPNDWCLLAMKEDHDPKVPDAPLATADAGSAPGSAEEPGEEPAGAAVVLESEIVECYEDLKQMTILLSNSSSLLNIEEVHLSFHRPGEPGCSWETSPVLRRFIRPTDWARMEGMLNFVMQLPASQVSRPVYFKKPILFRLPGESKSYLCSQEASVSRVDRGEFSPSTRFWLHMTAFNSSRVQKPYESELESISEDISGDSEW